MPFSRYLHGLLLSERFELDRRIDARAKAATTEAKRKRDERAALLSLCETRNRVGGWSA